MLIQIFFNDNSFRSGREFIFPISPKKNKVFTAQQIEQLSDTGGFILQRRNRPDYYTFSGSLHHVVKQCKGFFLLGSVKSDPLDAWGEQSELEIEVGG